MGTPSGQIEHLDKVSPAGDISLAPSAPGHQAETVPAQEDWADISREVYCILGIPIDVVEMPEVLQRLDAAVARKAPFFISTPNLDFLVISQFDPHFRESLLLSDLCPADGMPIIWIAQLLGIPLRHRLAGSDIFDALKAPQRRASPLKVFLFGAAPGVADAARRALNQAPGGLDCVGSMCPGFGTVEDMSRHDIISEINASDAEFLVVSLGSEKGQSWLHRNHRRLRIPIRAHLGAVVNFQAGTVKRAPAIMRKIGAEWLWRIKEEPRLWRRYWRDGTALLRLLLTHVLPLGMAAAWQRALERLERQYLAITKFEFDEHVVLALSGAACARHAGNAAESFRDALLANKPVVLDCVDTRFIDARFIGLLLMLRKCLVNRGVTMRFAGVSPRLERMFRLNGAGYLLAPDRLRAGGAPMEIGSKAVGRA